MVRKLVSTPCDPQPLGVKHGLGNRDQQGYEADLGHGQHMLWLDVEANDSDGHNNHRPADQGLGTVAVYSVPILLGFKSLPNAKAIGAVHLDFAQEKRNAHSNEHESQAKEGNGGLGVYGLHGAFLSGLMPAIESAQSDLHDLPEQLPSGGLDPVQELQVDGNPVEVRAVPKIGAHATKDSYVPCFTTSGTNSSTTISGKQLTRTGQMAQPMPLEMKTLLPLSARFNPLE